MAQGRALAVASTFGVVALILGASSSACSSHRADDEDDALGHASQALEAGAAMREIPANADSFVREDLPTRLPVGSRSCAFRRRT